MRTVVILGEIEKTQDIGHECRAALLTQQLEELAWETELGHAGTEGQAPRGGGGLVGAKHCVTNLSVFFPDQYTLLTTS